MPTQHKNTSRNDEHRQNDTLLPPDNPPPPPVAKDSTSLLSPWWSEEAVPTKEKERSEKSTHRHSTVVLGLQRHMEHKTDKDIGWKEKCYMYANVPKMEYKEKTDREKLEKFFAHSKECKMICFRRESRKLVKQRLSLEEKEAESGSNPLHGIWMSVAKTPRKCRDHVLGDQAIITMENYPDYYTVNLAREVCHPSEYATRMATKTFGPLHRLTQRYIDTWKDGTQREFFTSFRTRLERGDAFYLVKDCAKRLIGSVLGDQKPSDKK